MPDDNIIKLPTKEQFIDSVNATNAAPQPNENLKQLFAETAGSTLGFDSADEIGPAMNMRDWVRDAVQAQGAKMIGGGIGLGQADIDIELNGHRYNISIRTIKR